MATAKPTQEFSFNGRRRTSSFNGSDEKKLAGLFRQDTHDFTTKTPSVFHSNMGQLVRPPLFPTNKDPASQTNYNMHPANKSPVSDYSSVISSLTQPNCQQYLTAEDLNRPDQALSHSNVTSNYSSRPPKMPWKNNEVTTETKPIDRTYKKTDLSSKNSTTHSTRPSSVDINRYAGPTQLKEVRKKLELNLTETNNNHQHAGVLFVKNKETQLKHELAQSIIELIHDNERLLAESTSKLNSYLISSVNTKPGSCLLLVENLRKQWQTRISNLTKIFELVDSRKSASIPQHLFEVVYQTPRSLSKSIHEIQV